MGGFAILLKIAAKPDSLVDPKKKKKTARSIPRARLSVKWFPQEPYVYGPSTFKAHYFSGRPDTTARVVTHARLPSRDIQIDISPSTLFCLVDLKKHGETNQSS